MNILNFTESNITLLIPLHLRPSTDGVKDKRMHNMQKIDILHSFNAL